MERKTRPGWDDYFMEIARVVSSRSTCMRRSVGAVIVKNKQIVATGYNGTPKDLPHCEVTGCLREQLHVPSGRCTSFAAVFMRSRMLLFRLPIMVCLSTAVRCTVRISHVWSAPRF